MTDAKIIVVGAGIGGLTSACLLAKAGYEVTLLEAHTYPGGSAGTFYHQGYRFDAGATLAGGFQHNGPHRILADQLGIRWPVRPADSAWTVHLPGRSVVLDRDNSDMLAQFPQSESFWHAQKSVADQTWALAAGGLPWPPTSMDELRQLVQSGIRHFPADLRLLPLVFSTAAQWMSRHGLGADAEFVRLLDAQLLISAQTTSHHANALYSATALDLPRQGVQHVEGGMGGIAQTLAKTFESLGGRLLYRHQVTGIKVDAGRVRGLYVREGKRRQATDFVSADVVVANLTPATLDTLLGEDDNTSRAQDDDLNSWGAYVLHLGVEAAQLPAEMADHQQIVTSLDGPLGEGRSLFVSFSPEWDSSRAPGGHRAVTVSTHSEVGQWWRLLKVDPNAYEAQKRRYSDTALDAIDAVIPGFRSSVRLSLAGTPVTYQFYTGRQRGMVGGFPQTSLFKARGPRTGIANLYLVGDSVFPGQSTAGVTLSGMRVARAVQNKIERRSHHAKALHFRIEQR